MKNKDMYNSEGYYDPTAYGGIHKVMMEQHREADKRAYDLIKVLKGVISLAGFELTERVHLKDKKTGREYK